MGVGDIGTSLALIGRAAELGVLGCVLEDAARSRVRAVVIEGEAGIGKTRLTMEACRLAEGLGFRVLWGAGDEIERDRPLQGLADLVDVCREGPEARRGERGPTELGG